MSTYLREFATEQDYNTYINGSPLTPCVSLIDENESVKYKQKPDYSKQYLTCVALEDGTFKLDFPTLQSQTIDYSLDGGNTWVTLPKNTNTPTVHTGEKIMWKNAVTVGSGGPGTIQFTGQYKAEGNPMSLWFGDDFADKKDLTGHGQAFQDLFINCTGLTSVDNLVLPATTLANSCYNGMFYGCTSLTTAPELPATTLANYCYGAMFYGCTSLTTAPELPADTMADYCYHQMFRGCTSLTTAPELPATTLAVGCYAGMFLGCSSLEEAPELPATTLADVCYSSMFNGCTSLTTAPELPATTMATSGYSGMFQNCTSLTTAPELSATTLAKYCYRSMFKGCTNLSYIKMLATNTSASNCLNAWVNGVSPTGTFVKASSANLPTGDNGIPENWTVQNA